MRNQYNLLKEIYEQVSPITPVKGRYIYFVVDNELYQLNPYKQIEPNGMIMSMANNWKRARIMQGEDVRNILGQEVKDLRVWYEVDDSAPSDHVFDVYIGS